MVMLLFGVAALWMIPDQVEVQQVPVQQVQPAVDQEVPPPGEADR